MDFCRSMLVELACTSRCLPYELEGEKLVHGRHMHAACVSIGQRDREKASMFACNPSFRAGIELALCENICYLDLLLTCISPNHGHMPEISSCRDSTLDEGGELKSLFACRLGA